eukprot:5233505-Alexandrium_andersonii.AAC.1
MGRHPWNGRSPRRLTLTHTHTDTGTDRSTIHSTRTSRTAHATSATRAAPTFTHARARIHAALPAAVCYCIAGSGVLCCCR